MTQASKDSEGYTGPLNLLHVTLMILLMLALELPRFIIAPSAYSLNVLRVLDEGLLTAFLQIQRSTFYKTPSATQKIEDPVHIVVSAVLC